MSNNKKYTSEFKKTIVNLYHSGKSYSQIHSEYGVSSGALSNWIKLYSNVKLDDDTVITAQLEEENLILKKPLQYSLRTQTKIDRGKSPVQSAFCDHPMQSPQSQQEYILQIFKSFAFCACLDIYFTCPF